MATSKQVPSKNQGNKREKITTKAKQPVQKAPLEVLLVKNDAFEAKKEKLLDETQDYMYKQSSKFSNVSRALTLGIIGTIWIVIYNKDGFINKPNIWLILSLSFGLLFLLFDVIHYFMDSISYHKEAYRLEKYKTSEEIDEKHEPIMDDINKRSHNFLNVKFVILMTTSVLFIIGIIITATNSSTC